MRSILLYNVDILLLHITLILFEGLNGWSVMSTLSSCEVLKYLSQIFWYHPSQKFFSMGTLQKLDAHLIGFQQVFSTDGEMPRKSSVALTIKP